MTPTSCLPEGGGGEEQPTYVSGRYIKFYWILCLIDIITRVTKLNSALSRTSNQLLKEQFIIYFRIIIF